VSEQAPKPNAATSISLKAAGTRPSMNYLVTALLKYGASDLHLKAGRPPMYRVNGRLIPARMAELDSQDIIDILHEVLTEDQKLRFHNEFQVDSGFALDNVGRFRLNAYMQKGTAAGVIRLIPLKVPTLDDLNVPAVLKEIALKKRGLILVTGSTGSGKSTTLAAMINHINHNINGHIVTIEDPIEFMHTDAKCSISQREIGKDTIDSHQALIGALRQDPDVIMLGELRHRQTIETALSAAETGHLVLSTLHTNDAKSSLDRIIDVFPGDAQNQVRVSLAASLAAIVSQRLIPRADGKGRVAACEIMIKSKTIEDYILDNELDKIDEAIANSGSFYKMQTFNQHLEVLADSGTISREDALAASNKPDELKMRLSGLKKEAGF
jgi:twitching motility protein PilT